MQIPDYIKRRIRRNYPENGCVVPGSTPVVAFGDASFAKAATLGLNPSKVEFLHKGELLTDHSRRLATLESIGCNSLSNATSEQLAQILRGCNEYFQRNPYRRWFDQLDRVLQACGYSYYDGSACHLDLVQWATDPTWASLKPAGIRKGLIQNDAHFLADQLRNERIELLLINGSGVFREFRRIFDIPYRELEAITKYGQKPTRLHAGLLFNRIEVIAWSTNLQSSFGVTNARRCLLGETVAKVAGCSPST